MKKFAALFLIFCFIYFLFSPVSYAKQQDAVTFTAETISKLYVEGIIEKRILKKFIPVKITVTNNSAKRLNLSNRISYITANKEYNVPNSAAIFNKTKRNTVKRAILWSIPTILTLGILAPAIPISIAHSIYNNENLEDMIAKTNYRQKDLLDGDWYSSYIFIPNKHKNVTEIIIKDVNFEDEESFEIKAAVTNERL